MHALLVTFRIRARRPFGQVFEGKNTGFGAQNMTFEGHQGWHYGLFFCDQTAHRHCYLHTWHRKTCFVTNAA